MEWTYLLIGLVIGGIGAWYMADAQSRRALEALRAQISESNRDSLAIVQKEITDKNAEIVRVRKLYDDANQASTAAQTKLEAAQTILESREDLKGAYAVLSQEALKTIKVELIQQADSRIGQTKAEIDNLLQPLTVALKNYKDQTALLEAHRQEAYGGLKEQVSAMALSNQLQTKVTGDLVSALRKPQVRGQWGEIGLRNAVEEAGMSQHCDFVEQPLVDGEDGRVRPDMIVHIPEGGNIVVDSKVPLEGYLDAIAAESDEQRSESFQRHARHVREHLDKLANKKYWKPFGQSPDFVIMFIRAESMLSAALDSDPSLLKDGIRRDVILATPTTLIALLRMVALGWRQEQFAENEKRIRELGAEIYDRIATFVENFSGVGKSLGRAVESYDEAVGSLERRVLVSVRKLREYGATKQNEISEPASIELIPRAIQTNLLSDGRPDDA